MKKQKKKKVSIEELYANMFAYEIQDTLDDLSQGGRFNFNQAEKKFKKYLISFKRGER